MRKQAAIAVASSARARIFIFLFDCFRALGNFLPCIENSKFFSL